MDNLLKGEIKSIGVIGLGYVGLPLAIEFGKRYKTIGYDINVLRINELNTHYDRTNEVKNEDFYYSNQLTFTHDLSCLKECNIYIITVPTPIDLFKKPNLEPLLNASKNVGKLLNVGDIIIYESTVYPGCTEEDCVPVLEQESGLKYNLDFFCGYSPERINPGDKKYTLTKIKKVTSGSTLETANLVDKLYSSIVEAGTFKARTIKVAEAAKVIENCQRDINIAFVNELAMIFKYMQIDIFEVLEAAGTKWNFLSFQPGLVGGHCIGVDPYYLTYKAESYGYHPEVILAGRRINDNMGKYVASEMIKHLIRRGESINNCKILVLGITFKENCPDIRNSRVIDIIQELIQYGIEVSVSDDFADSDEVLNEYNVMLKNEFNLKDFGGIIVAVAHGKYSNQEFVKELISLDKVIFDVKGILPYHKNIKKI